MLFSAIIRPGCYSGCYSVATKMGESRTTLSGFFEVLYIWDDGFIALGKGLFLSKYVYGKWSLLFGRAVNEAVEKNSGMAEPKPSNGKRHSHQASYKSGCSSWMLVAGSEWQGKPFVVDILCKAYVKCG